MTTESYKQQKMKYMLSPAGRKSVAKSWIRKYIRDGNVTTKDVKEVIKEFD